MAQKIDPATRVIASLHSIEEQDGKWRMRLTLTDKQHQSSKTDYYTRYIYDNQDLAAKDAGIAKWLLVNQHPLKKKLYCKSGRR